MIRPTKLNLVGSIFVILGLLSSIAHANTEVKTKAQYAFVIHSAVNHISVMAKNINVSYSPTSVNGKIFNESNKLNQHLFSQHSKKPLLGIQVTDFTNLVPNKFEKKNSFFEFAAKFNDKLQQLLAYFDFSAKSTARDNEAINTEQAKRKIHLSNQNSILQLQLPLKQDCNTRKN
jgi:hypothetical protein|tara:strand:+ start:6909 stop:7433 length:525 start_codon:yes stop_codon:yes gene_type:complete